MIPLPDEGAGLPIDDAGNAMTGGTPVIPLPDEGAGLPIDDEGNAILPPSTPSIPSIPSMPTVPSTPSIPSIPSTPIPSTPSYPNWFQAARVRFLHAAYGYPTFRIRINSIRMANWLTYASISTYGRAPAGYQTVTVSGMDGYIYLQKTIPIQYGTASTIAVINRAGGLDLLQIQDSCCSPGDGSSNFRVGNLAYNSPPMDVLLGDGRVVYSDVRFKETTSFKRIRPGEYQFFFAETDLTPMPAWMDIETLDSAFLGEQPPAETVASVYINVLRNNTYTVYLLRSGAEQNAIQTMVVID